MATILYHNDSIGHAAVNVARVMDSKVRFVATGFSAIPWNLLNAGEQVLVVGLFLDEQAYIRLSKYYDTYIYTNSDTEISKCDAVIAKGHVLKGTRTVKKAPCLSLWEDSFPDKVPPKALLYLSDYHTWTFEYAESEPFKYGLSLYYTKPSKTTVSLWNKLFSDDIDTLNQCILNGQDIMKYHNLLFQEYQDELAYGTKLGKIPALACNVRYNSKILVDHRNEEYYPIFLNYDWHAELGKYQVSIYTNSDKHHAGDIARQYGGGGSQGVGAFKCVKLPFEEKQINHENEIDGADRTPYMDTHVESKNVLKRFAAAKFAYKQNQTDVLMRSYTTMLNDYKIKACNTPYNELDAFYPMELTGEVLAVTYVWTNFGKYRIVMMPLLSSVDLKLVAEQYGGKVHKGKVYTYTHTLPFEQ